MEWFVPAPDGRTLAVTAAGDPAGRPVLLHHGTPGGRRLFGRRTIADAERRGLRRISYDRPGYGGSTAQPGRATADCAADVRAICEALGIEGAWEDCVTQITPWGFEVTQISVPVLLLHGGQDTAVPVSHGQWLAAHIPGVEAWFFEDEGHGLREKHIADINGWLIDHGA